VNQRSFGDCPFAGHAPAVDVNRLPVQGPARAAG
jgi:hypothetical protein